MDSTSRVDIGMGTVRSATSLEAVSANLAWTVIESKGTYIAVDPFEPMLGAMASLQVLKIIDNRNVLRLGSTKEVVLDGVRTSGTIKSVHAY